MPITINIVAENAGEALYEMRKLCGALVQNPAATAAPVAEPLPFNGEKGAEPVGTINRAPSPLWTNTKAPGTEPPPVEQPVEQPKKRGRKPKAEAPAPEPTPEPEVEEIDETEEPEVDEPEADEIDEAPTATLDDITAAFKAYAAKHGMDALEKNGPAMLGYPKVSALRKAFEAGEIDGAYLAEVVAQFTAATEEDA